jgi:hypothetical protein
VRRQSTYGAVHGLGGGLGLVLKLGECLSVVGCRRSECSGSSANHKCLFVWREMRVGALLYVAETPLEKKSQPSNYILYLRSLHQNSRAKQKRSPRAYSKFCSKRQSVVESPCNSRQAFFLDLEV